MVYTPDSPEWIHTILQTYDEFPSSLLYVTIRCRIEIKVYCDGSERRYNNTRKTTDNVELYTQDGCFSIPQRHSRKLGIIEVALFLTRSGCPVTQS